MHLNILWWPLPTDSHTKRNQTITEHNNVLCEHKELSMRRCSRGPGCHRTRLPGYKSCALVIRPKEYLFDQLMAYWQDHQLQLAVYPTLNAGWAVEGNRSPTALNIFLWGLLDLMFLNNCVRRLLCADVESSCSLKRFLQPQVILLHSPRLVLKVSVFGSLWVLFMVCAHADRIAVALLWLAPLTSHI